MEFDIFVPSKGRPDGASFDLLMKARLPFTIVIEPQDVATYRETFRNNPLIKFLVLPRNNKGIGYSRGFVLSSARRPFVMIDDDIHTIYNAGRRIGFASMLKAGWKQYVATGKQGVLGFKNTTFALPDNPITMNTVVAHIVFMTPYDKIEYDTRLRAFEDIDIVFQCFKQGLPIQRLNTFVYYTTPSGKGTHGGIDYGKNAQVKLDALSIMLKRWPKMISYDKNNPITGNGQPKYKIHMK